MMVRGQFLHTASLDGMLDRHGWAGYVALNPEHVFLLTGFMMPLHMNTNPLVPAVAVYTPKVRALVVPRIQLAYLAQADLTIDLLVTFGAFDIQGYENSEAPDARSLSRWLAKEHRAPAWLSAVTQAVTHAGLIGAELGCDEPGLLGELPAMLAAQVRCQLVAGTAAFRQVRRRKTPAAAAVMERAAAIVEESIVETLARTHPGTTQGEAHRFYRAAVGRRGGTAGHVGIGFGPASVLPINRPTARPLQHGDVIKLDVGALYEGFFADTARVVTVGPPSHEAQRIYGALLEAEQEATTRVRTGASVRDIFTSMMERVRRTIPSYTRPHCGHAIGVSRYEVPLIADEPDATLLSGEMINIEVPLYDFRVGGLNVEDTIWALDEGPRLLTRLPRELMEIGDFLSSARSQEGDRSA
jgi:Xaa-Pro aminopeptidase